MVGLYPDVQVCVNALRMEKSQATAGDPCACGPPGISSKAAMLEPIIIVYVTVSTVSEKICVLYVTFCPFTC